MHKCQVLMCEKQAILKCDHVRFHSQLTAMREGIVAFQSSHTYPCACDGGGVAF